MHSTFFSGESVCQQMAGATLEHHLFPMETHAVPQLRHCLLPAPREGWQCSVDWSHVCRGVQPVGRGLHATLDGYECNLHKIINALKTLWDFFVITIYLICGPRQFFFYQCGPEMPKGWTPLIQDILESQGPQTPDVFVIKSHYPNHSINGLHLKDCCDWKFQFSHL